MWLEIAVHPSRGGIVDSWVASFLPLSSESQVIASEFIAAALRRDGFGYRAEISAVAVNNYSRFE